MKEEEQKSELPSLNWIEGLWEEPLSNWRLLLVLPRGEEGLGSDQLGLGQRRSAEPGGGLGCVLGSHPVSS